MTDEWADFPAAKQDDGWGEFKPATQPNAIIEGAKDIGKSAGVGLAKGVLQGATMGANVRSAALQGLNYLGVPEEYTKGINEVASKLPSHPLLPTGPTSEEAQKRIESATGEFYKPQTTAGRYAESVGEMAPAVIGGPGGIVRRTIGQAVIPGVAAQGAEDLVSDEKMKPWARTAAAVVSPMLAQKLITPMRAAANPERARAIQTLRNEGVTDLTAGDITGNRRLRYQESELAPTRYEEIVRNRNEQYTRAALRRVGEDAPYATQEVLNRAHTRIGGEFDRIAAQNTLRPDTILFQDIGRARNAYNRLHGPNAQVPLVQDTVDDIIHQIMTSAVRGNQVPGEIYGTLRSQIGAEARRARTDPNLQHTLYELQGALDASMMRTLRATNPQAVADLQTARRQYRNMLVIERAATRAGEEAAEGIILPNNLATATTSLHGLRNFARGQGDFAALAQAGRHVFGRLPNSGTAQRARAHAVPSLIGGTLGAALGTPGGLPGHLAGAAVGLAVPHAMGRYILSPLGRQHFSNQRLPADPNPFASALTRGAFAGQ